MLASVSMELENRVFPGMVFLGNPVEDDIVTAGICPISN